MKVAIFRENPPLSGKLEFYQHKPRGRYGFGPFGPTVIWLERWAADLERNEFPFATRVMSAAVAKSQGLEVVL